MGPQRVGDRFRLGHRPALTGIRALAIAPVIAHHTGFAWAGRGYFGVDVFFVLSGFLITSLLIEERERDDRVSLRRFWARRAFRLLPALVIMLGACAIYAGLFPHRPDTQHFWRDAGATFGYFANWTAALNPHIETNLLTHTWSLSVEEQFYLVWPLLLAFLLARRVKLTTVAVLASIGVLASVQYRAIALVGKGPLTAAMYNRVYHGLDGRGAALMIGCLLALVVYSVRLPSGRAVRWAVDAAALLACAGLAWAVLGHRFAGTAIIRDPVLGLVGGLLLVDGLAAVVILGVVMAPRGVLARLLSLRPLVWIGTISYGLYLWNFPVERVLFGERAHFPANNAHVALIAVALTIAIAALSYVLVERPVLRLAGRFRTARHDVAGRAPRHPVSIDVTRQPVPVEAAG